MEPVTKDAGVVGVPVGSNEQAENGVPLAPGSAQLPGRQVLADKNQLAQQGQSDQNRGNGRVEHGHKYC